MLRYKRVVLFLCLLLLGLPAAVRAGAVKMPPGSFLTRPVSTPEDISNLVKQDRVVALRYSRHFGMPPASLADYFRKSLSASTLKKTGNYTVYYIAKNGKILVHQKKLKAGERIFVDLSGAPVIEMRCGNPLTASLAQPLAKALTQPEPAPATPVEAPKIEPVPQPEPPVVVTEPGPAEVQGIQMAELVAPEPVQAEVLAQPPIELSRPSVPAVIPSSGGKGVGWLVPGLVGLGAAGALSGGGGGGGGSNPPPSPPPVPEPATLLALGIGAAGLVSRYRMMRR